MTTTEDRLRLLHDLPVTVPDGLAARAWHRGRRRHRLEAASATLGVGLVVGGATAGALALAGSHVAPRSGSVVSRPVGVAAAPVPTARPSRRIPGRCTVTNGDNPLTNPTTPLRTLERLLPNGLDKVTLGSVPGFPVPLNGDSELPIHTSAGQISKGFVGPACGPFRYYLVKEWSRAAGRTVRTNKDGGRGVATPWISVSVATPARGFMSLNADGTYSSSHHPVVARTTVEGFPALVELPGDEAGTQEVLLFSTGRYDVSVWVDDHRIDKRGQLLTTSRTPVPALTAIAHSLHGLSGS